MGSKNCIISDFYKDCPNCLLKMYYTTIGGVNEATRLNRLCIPCAGIVTGNGKRLNNSLTQEQRLQGIATRLGYETYTDYEAIRPAKDKYKALVQKLTEQQPIQTLENHDKRGLCGVIGAYQLDHIYPISKGFENNIEPEVIAHIDNLQIIPWKENLLKSNK